MSTDETRRWILNAVWGVLIAVGLFILHGINDSLKDLNQQIRELNTVVVNGLSREEADRAKRETLKLASEIRQSLQRLYGDMMEAKEAKVNAEKELRK